jgi:DNA-directed RNA polymerase specialized sigma24 family protein
MREHGAVLGRVCMALLGDAEAAERALERVASEAGGAGVAKFEDGKDVLARLMGMVRVACANQLSKLPIRTSSGIRPEDRAPETAKDRSGAPTLARAVLGKLKPTEREAVVLHIVGGLDAAHVAEACGIDLATARSRIARGVAQLVEEEKHR